MSKHYKNEEQNAKNVKNDEMKKSQNNLKMRYKYNREL